MDATCVTGEECLDPIRRVIGIRTVVKCLSIKCYMLVVDFLVLSDEFIDYEA